MEKDTPRTTLSVTPEDLTSSVLRASEVLTRQTLALQMPTIEQMALTYSQIMQTFDFTPVIQSAIEMNKKLSDLQKTFGFFSPMQKNVYITPDVKRSKPVIIVKEISEQQEDRIADKILARLHAHTNIKGHPLLLTTSSMIINLPENTSWETLTLTFETPNEISVHYKDDFKGRFSYEELGFFRSSTKLKTANMAWGFLLLLAIGIKNKSSSIEDLASGTYFEKKESIHTSRTALSKQLKKTFGISEDPFYSYKEEGCYKTKFKLIPPPDIRHRELIMQSGSNDLREGDYLSY